jgi:hypothetical protein
MSTARLIAESGHIAFYSPYDPGLLSDFKAAVPPADRRWDGSRKCWLVAPARLPALERICATHGLSAVKQLTALYDAPQVVQRIIRVDYIGAPKPRDDGQVTALGNSGGEWSVVFPEEVLRAWFDCGLPQAPTAPLTYYAALGVKQNATPEEVKRGYRSMAKRWHPDVNKDPDAKPMFQRIGAAYEVLSDPDKRRRYDAGLALEATLTGPRVVTTDVPHWRPPVRCGLILVEGTERLGRVIVAKILAWQPIVNARGQELVTSWPMGAETWQEEWV